MSKTMSSIPKGLQPLAPGRAAHPGFACSREFSILKGSQQESSGDGRAPHSLRPLSGSIAPVALSNPGWRCAYPGLIAAIPSGYNARGAGASRWIVLAIAITLFASPTSLRAGGEPTSTPTSPPQEAIHEIFVPFGDLQPLLENQPQRVLLSRKEYDDLLEKAKLSPPKHPSPVPAMISSADYEMTSDGQRVDITGTLSIDILDEGIHAIPLDLGSVGLLAAQYVDESGNTDARIGRARNQRLHLLVSGVGVHVLKLSLVAPLETTSAQQVLSLRLPRGPVGSWKLRVPGDVEIKAGASIVSRKVDKAARTTQFELLPIAGQATLVMSLNSHVQRTEQAVAARCVVFDTVTEGFEKVRANATFVVLHKAIDRLRFVAPEGFEITDVTCPNLMRWEMAKEAAHDKVPARSVVTVTLREQTTDKIELSVAAMKVGGTLTPWHAPRFELLDVVSQVSLVGLLVEERLNVDSMEPKDLIPIDTAAIVPGLPPEFNAPAADGSRLRLVAAWYAPQSDYSLSATIKRPPEGYAVNTVVQLVLRDKGGRAAVQFTLAPEQEPCFDFDVAVPANWEVEPDIELAAFGIRIERYTPAGKPGRIHVHLPQGIAVGQIGSIAFHAAYHPEGWLGDWKNQKVEFPAFHVLGSKRDDGQWIVQSEDDLVVRPEKLEKITPLVESEIGVRSAATPQNADAAILAYRYAGPESRATLNVERTQPRITARTFSFFQVKPEGVTVHDEIIYRVEDAKTRELWIDLPLTTPEALSIRGLGGVAVKEYAPQVVDNKRRWHVLLADARRGELHLAVDFQLNNAPAGKKTADEDKAPASELKDFSLPMIETTKDIAYSSGAVGIEGGAELDVEVKTHAGKVDVGQLAAAEYQPGRRLLGAYAFVGPPLPFAISVARHPGFALTPVIVDSAHLKTLLGAHGESQTQANYLLRTKVSYISVELPQGAELWSAALDKTPLKPQKSDHALLIGLPPAAEGTVRDLQLVYSGSASGLEQSSRIHMNAPKLYLPFQASSSTADPSGQAVEHVPIPIIKTQWNLVLPPGMDAIDDSASEASIGIRRPASAPVVVGRILYRLGGGVWSEPQRLHAYGGVENRTSSVMDLYALITDGAPVTKSTESTVTSTVSSEAAANAPAAAPELDIDPNLEKPGSDKAPFGNAPPRRKALSFGAPTQRGLYKGKDLAELKQPTVIVQEEDQEKIARIDDSQSMSGKKNADKKSGGEGKSVAPRNDREVDDSLIRGDTGKTNLFGLSAARSLLIDVQQADAEQSPGLFFVSLDPDPTLDVALVDHTRLHMLAWAAGLVAFFLGVLQTHATVRRKVGVIVGMGFIAAILPVLWYTVTMQVFCNAIFYAALALIPFYIICAILLAVGRSIASAWCACCGKVSSATVVILFITLSLSCSANLRAESPESNTVVVVQEPPISPVPDDAILLPYDPDVKSGLPDITQVFMPYARYTELWERAHPGKKAARPAPLPYALSNAAYSATLNEKAAQENRNSASSGSESLVVRGKMHVDILADGYVSIPLWMAGGVLARANLDGKPAQLNLVRPESISVQKGKAASGTSSAVADALIVLQVSGTGGHELEVEARLKIARQGGWRMVEGAIPAAPAGRVLLTVPTAPTEVRLTLPSDHRIRETEKPGEVIETALGSAGELSLRWRPTVNEDKSDSSLAVESTGFLDVQEDGLHAAWQVRIQFRRGQRDTFTLDVPDDYRLEKVAGSNVKGWDLRTRPGHATVDVALLKAAKENEQFTLFLSRTARVGAAGADPAELQNFSMPLVTVEGAVTTTGRLSIHRSPRIDLRTVSADGLTRIDDSPLPDMSAGPGTDETVLTSRRYEAYRFAAVPFDLKLHAEATQAQLSATLQTIVKMAEPEPSLQSRITYHITDRPVYSFRVVVPDDLVRPILLATGLCQWSIESMPDPAGGKRQVMTINMSTGQTGDVLLEIDGSLKPPGKDKAMPLPRVEIVDVALHPIRQSGDTVVQTDPAYDLQVRDLHGCQEVPLDSAAAWLDANQKALARVALHFNQAHSQAVLQLIARRPDVACDTISNVKVTDRAIEETIVLHYTVQKAGIHELEFLLPASMADARIAVNLLRQKTIEPVPADKLAKGAEPMVRVRLELQEDVMNEFVVRIMNDRLLTPGAHTAPIPAFDDAHRSIVHRQFVTLEGGSRDELIVDSTDGLETLGRQQREWQVLAQVLGNQLQQVYLVAPGASRPKLAFHMVHHEDIETAGARIDLAQTTLVVDALGDYRAMIELSLDNSSEQFLDVELPADAQLWTVRVADQAVKPVKFPAKSSAAADDRHVLVPVLKTAAGDLNYPVVLKYGGKLGKPGLLSTVNFPLIHNIQSYPAGKAIGIARSQVVLYLPKKQDWFNFSGTLHPVQDEADIQAGRVELLNKQAQRLLEIARGKDEYAKARAESNLNIVCTESEKVQSELGRSRGGNERLANELSENSKVLSDARARLKDLGQAQQTAADSTPDNREKLENYYRSQTVTKAKGELNVVGNNSYTGGTVITGGNIFQNNRDGLTKPGAGTMVLSGSNTYTGNTTISSGTLQAGNGGFSSPIVQSNGSVLSQQVQGFSAPITQNIGGISVTSPVMQQNSQIAGFRAPITQNLGGQNVTAPVLATQPNAAYGTAAVGLQGNNPMANIAVPSTLGGGRISGAGGRGDYTVNGAGSLTISGQQQAAGQNFANGSSNLTLNGGDFNSNWIARNGLANNYPATPTADNAPPYTVDALSPRSGSTTFAGTIVPSQAPGSAEFLTGSNNYTGGIINNGTLSITGSGAANIDIAGANSYTETNSLELGSSGIVTRDAGGLGGRLGGIAVPNPAPAAEPTPQVYYGPSTAPLPAAAPAPAPAAPPPQVVVGGQTLPSPHYLQDDIQYFPAGPQLPLSKEAKDGKDDGKKDLQLYQKKLNVGNSQIAGFTAPTGNVNATASSVYDKEPQDTGRGAIYTVPKPTYLASLDFDLPRDGEVYRFATPRGEVELSARTVSKQFEGRSFALLAILLAGLVVWLCLRWLPRVARAIWNSTLALALLAIVAFILGCCGMFPFACFLLVAAILVSGFCRWVLKAKRLAV